MKKVFAFIVLFSAMTMAASAQGVKFGVKGGLDLQNMKFNENVFDSENKLGWFIGPTLQISLPIGGLGVDISGLYDQKSTKINGETIKQKSILVPINARLKLGIGGEAGLYVAAGPQFAFNVGDDEFKWTSGGFENQRAAGGAEHSGGRVQPGDDPVRLHIRTVLPADAG